MKTTKKTKLITLIISILVIAGIGTGAYLMMRENDTPVQDTPSEQTGDNTPVQSSNAAQSSSAVQSEDEPTPIEDSLILVPGGTFTMGSPGSERQRNEDEAQHDVTIKAFYVDPYEVKQADYAAVMGVNPSHFNGSNLPVENVTWYDAVAYCNKLSESRDLTPVYEVNGNTVIWDRSADGYRLLTEAEWEYAARAGTNTIYNFGDQVNSNLANFEGSYPYLIEENYVRHSNPDVVTSRYRGETISVDELAPNGFGLYNTHGNVSEWCFDYYGEYNLQNTTDPVGVSSGSLRVNRGGSYIDFGKHLRSAYRSATNPIDTDQNLGFRICRNANGMEETVTTAYSLNISIPESPRILVAYFSYSGNTEEAAKMIEEKTGADLVEIVMEKPYRGNIYEVSQQDLNNNVHPALSTRVDNMNEYDVILLGYPTWWATLPMPVVTFLESYDFTGKTIVPFSSHGGTMFGDSISDLSKRVPGTYVGLGYEFNYSSSSSSGISAWLAENGIAER